MMGYNDNVATIPLKRDIHPNRLRQQLSIHNRFLTLSLHQTYTRCLYAVLKGFLDSLEVADIVPFSEQLMEQMVSTYPDLMEKLEQTQKMTPAMQSVLDEALRELSTVFLAQKQKLFEERAAP